jgi:hypothetical protein
MKQKLGILTAALIAAAMTFATAARADCEAECKSGFDVCIRNCGGQSGCLATCSRGHEGCMRRCEGRSMNFTEPQRLACAPVRKIALRLTAKPDHSSTCERIGEGGIPPSQPLAISCSSSEWCCKHDIRIGGGECIKCCPRP